MINLLIHRINTIPDRPNESSVFLQFRLKPRESKTNGHHRSEEHLLLNLLRLQQACTGSNWVRLNRKTGGSHHETAIIRRNDGKRHSLHPARGILSPRYTTPLFSTAIIEYHSIRTISCSVLLCQFQKSFHKPFLHCQNEPAHKIEASIVFHRLVPKDPLPARI